ncbi:hypothetical protein SprV_0301036200 [Sparganum proliferum]
MTGASIYESNRIAATKDKREARKSQLRPPSNANAQPPPTCPRCRRIFRARIGLRINCATQTAPTVVPPSASSSSSPSQSISDRTPEQPLLSSPSSSSTAPRSAFVAPDASSNINITPSTPAVRTRIAPALTATAPSPHTSAWSVTCESIAQRLANRCQKHQPTPTAVESPAQNAPARSRTAWVYSTTYESTNTCGRQPPAAPHHQPSPLPHHHPTTHQHSPTAINQLPPPTQVGSVRRESVSMRLLLHR